MTSHTDIIRWADQLYAGGPLPSSALQRYRPYICPFELLVDCVPARSQVLDVGCGSGLFLGLLAKAGRISRGLGFDVHGAAIALANAARRRLPDPDVLQFVHAVDDFEWPVGCFDVVSMVDVMHHVAPDQQPSIIDKMARALRPGGLLLYKDMAQRPLWRASANRLHDLVLARQWIHYLPIDQVVSRAGTCGLSLVQQQTVNRLWYGHEFALFQLRTH